MFFTSPPSSKPRQHHKIKIKTKEPKTNKRKKKTKHRIYKTNKSTLSLFCVANYSWKWGFPCCVIDIPREAY